jgi:hypothetical protein
MHRKRGRPLRAMTYYSQILGHRRLKIAVTGIISLLLQKHFSAQSAVLLKMLLVLHAIFIKNEILISISL